MPTTLPVSVSILPNPCIMVILIILLLCLWSASIYKEEEMNAKQLEIDITLTLIKLSPVQKRIVVDKIDRNFDCVKELDMKFTDIVVQPNERYFLRFEHSTTLIPAYFGICDLSTEDKIYLLDLIKKI